MSQGCKVAMWVAREVALQMLGAEVQAQCVLQMRRIKKQLGAPEMLCCLPIPPLVALRTLSR
jgi:hypothetical protein